MRKTFKTLMVMVSFTCLFVTASIAGVMPDSEMVAKANSYYTGTGVMPDSEMVAKANSYYTGTGYLVER